MCFPMGFPIICSSRSSSRSNLSFTYPDTARVIPSENSKLVQTNIPTIPIAFNNPSPIYSDLTNRQVVIANTLITGAHPHDLCEIQINEREQALEIAQKENIEMRLKLEAQTLKIMGLEEELSHIARTEEVKRAELEARLTLNEKDKYENGIIYSYTNHEVRNIIQSIIATLESGGEVNSIVSSELSNVLRSIHCLAKELHPLLNTSLDLAKIFNNQMKLEQESFSYVDLKNSITTQFAYRNKNGVAFSILDSPSIPYNLIGDSHRLNQVLTNFLTNAFKFTEAGSITLNIDVISSTSKEAVLNFSVEDTGTGISQEVIGTLAQPFRQADASIARKSGGTGLGLYISKLLINLMNGEHPTECHQNTIQIQSEVGKGTVFSFNVKFQIPQIIIKLPSAPVLRRESLQDCKILLADDDNKSLRIIRKNLELYGAQVSEANNGEQVIQKISTGKCYDAILLDMNMPYMDGLTTAKELDALRLKSPQSIPIPIPCTGDSSEDDWIKYQEAGMKLMLPKPFKIADAVKAVLLSKNELKKRSMSSDV